MSATLPSRRFSDAIAAFDAYHRKDPGTEMVDGELVPAELLYAQRMTQRLEDFAPDAEESVRLAARCQHIGRWEIPREKYPMDRAGYLRWRTDERIHHAAIAEKILAECQYDAASIEEVKYLVLKKGLHTHPPTQLLEDVACLVFIEHYLESFAAKHDDEKVVTILQKTLKKMSPQAKAATHGLSLSATTRALLANALEGSAI